MGDKTAIEWTRGDDGSRGATWNPVTGCTKVSLGCDRCYIERTPPFRIGRRKFDGDGPGATTGVLLHPERLGQPIAWQRPRRIFVNSLSDLFHDAVPDEYIARIWAVMALAPRHTFQILTKRHDRMRSLLSSPSFWSLVADQGRLHHAGDATGWLQVGAFLLGKPLPNVWLGVTVENQKYADLRIDRLLRTPAAVRFLSCEPLLGPVSLHRYMPDAWGEGCLHNPRDRRTSTTLPTVDWVIAGGESGPDARPMHISWARSLRDQCVASHVAFHFKQWGEWAPHLQPGDAGGQDYRFPDGTLMNRVGKKAAGRLLDGRTWDQTPVTKTPVNTTKEA